MSGPEAAEPRLKDARAHLERKGYLRGVPPGGSRSRAVLRYLGVAGALAVVLATVAVASAGERLLALPLLGVALLPAVAALVVLGGIGGRIVARWLLRAGGQPHAVSTALAVIAVAAVAVAAAAAGRRPEDPSYGALVPALAGVVAVAIWVYRLVGAAILRDLTLGDGLEDGSEAARSVWRPPVVAGAVLLACVVAALLWQARPVAPATDEGRLAVTPPAGRVAVLAVDGLSRQDLVAAARLVPQLQNLAGWAWAELEGPPALLPAVRWTTIACGAPPARHGVEAMDEVVLFGREGLVLAPAVQAAVTIFWHPLGAAHVVARPALSRRLPTFWEMASRAGCPVVVGGWWGSWPVRRVLGSVATERAWLGGGFGADAVTPDLAATVRDVWREQRTAAGASDQLALRLAASAAQAQGAELVALSLPALDLEKRAEGEQPPIALSERLLPHLLHLAEVASRLESGGFAVWLVALPWGPGTPFVASSAPPGGKMAPVAESELVSTWLDQLGLPPPVDAQPPRRDLSDVRLPGASPVAYGPPPPPRAAPSTAGAAVQREVLRSLGYLQ